MKTTWLLLTLVSGIATSPSATSQMVHTPAREILKAGRALQPQEIAIALAGAREAVAGKTCRLSYTPNGPGPEVLMGANGRPRFVRGTSGYDYRSGALSGNSGNGRIQTEQRGHIDLVTFTDYTGRSARKCDGTAVDGELVLEYERRSSDDHWTVTARTRTPHDFAASLFDMLAGTTPVEAPPWRSSADRVGRAFVAPWKLPPGAQAGGPLPPGVTQMLWIDTGSLLPLRWSISIPAMPEQGIPAIPGYGLLFTYDSSLDLQPPGDVAPPDCMP
jgi:hypothetical protein